MKSEQKIGFVLTVLIVLFCIATFVIKCSGGMNIVYSEGSRSGQIQKLSKKGLYWKTWEGELNLGYMESVPSEDGHRHLRPAIFLFSVENESVVKELKSAELHGRRVTINYKQYLLRGYDKGSTAYDVTSVETYVPSAEAVQ